MLIKLLRSNQEITLFAFKMQTRSKCLLVIKTINITNVLTHFLWLNYLQNVVTLSSLNIHKSNSSRVFSQGTSTSAAAPAESLLNYWILSHFRLIGISRVQFNKSRFFINLQPPTPPLRSRRDIIVTTRLLQNCNWQRSVVVIGPIILIASHKFSPKDTNLLAMGKEDEKEGKTSNSSIQLEQNRRHWNMCETRCRSLQYSFPHLS